MIVVCDPTKLDDKGCKGAPDLALEIVSQFSASRDYIKKLRLYKKHGIREYWIVNPNDNSVAIYLLNEKGNYEKAFIYGVGEKIKVTILGNLVIDLMELFR